MSHMNAKTATALVGAVALTASGLAAAAPVLADGTAQAPLAASQHNVSAATAESGFVKMANVQGDFSYDQGVLTSTEDISNRFAKAAATLCTNMSTYFETREAQPIEVGGDVNAGFSATLSDMADEEGVDAYDMACSCASNVAGGGAIANAEVEGVSLASIADMAQAN